MTDDNYLLLFVLVAFSPNDILLSPMTTRHMKKTIQPNQTSKVLKWLTGIEAPVLSIYENDNAAICKCFGVPPNKILVQYLHWCFRQKFLVVFLSAALIYLSFAFAFAVPIYLMTQRHPECVIGLVPDDDDYDGPPTGTFLDAFQLSWTTFGTVGYGILSVGTSVEEISIIQCTWLKIVVSLEAFIGILFASIFGAILVARVARVQRFAQVAFSDPIVVRYGSGVEIETREEDDEQDTEMMDDLVAEPVHPSPRSAPIPCPVLEFRITNQLHGTPRGEIIDGCVKVIAGLDGSQTVLYAKDIGDRQQKIRRRKNGIRNSNLNRRSTSTKATSREVNAAAYTPSRLNHPRYQQQAIAEDPSGKFGAKRIFAQLDLESAVHPFFKRVWFVRHTLNESSPILKPSVRRMVQLNGGSWPEPLNSHSRVRESIHFDQILVTFSGISNVDANAVYEQKAYDMRDMYVGYRFASLIYRNHADGSLRMDPGLISDITEQDGGGGEPLDYVLDYDNPASLAPGPE